MRRSRVLHGICSGAAKAAVETTHSIIAFASLVSGFAELHGPTWPERSRTATRRVGRRCPRILPCSSAGLSAEESAKSVEPADVARAAARGASGLASTCCCVAERLVSRASRSASVVTAPLDQGAELIGGEDASGPPPGVEELSRAAPCCMCSAVAPPVSPLPWRASHRYDPGSADRAVFLNRVRESVGHRASRSGSTPACGSYYYPALLGFNPCSSRRRRRGVPPVAFHPRPARGENATWARAHGTRSSAGCRRAHAVTSHVSPR